MTCKAIQVSKEQETAIDLLGRRLAEMGRVLVSVDPRFARSADDMFAIPKHSPSAASAIWIRPERDGSVCVRPYAGKSLGRTTKECIQQCRKDVGVPLRWRSRPLFFVAENKLPWYERISADGRETLKVLKVAFW